MASIPFDHFDVLTFDCYGTLIDWEAGLLAGLRAILDPRGVAADDEDLLARYAGTSRRSSPGRTSATARSSRVAVRGRAASWA